MGKRNDRPIGVMLAMLVLAGTTMAETTAERGRRAEGMQAHLTEEGRAVLEAHMSQQREEMQAQMRAQQETRQALRAALGEATDPHQQLDILAEHVKARQQMMLSRQEQNQEARLAAYREALETSGVEESDRDRILQRMEQRQARQQENVASRSEELLKEIAALRDQDDVTEGDIRTMMRSVMGPAQRERGRERERSPQRERRPDQGRERVRGRRQVERND